MTEEERAEAQRWALDLSRIADPEARQATLATAPVHWQPTIRHDLAWRLGMAAVFDRRHTGYDRKAVNSLRACSQNMRKILIIHAFLK